MQRLSVSQKCQARQHAQNRGGSMLRRTAELTAWFVGTVHSSTLLARAPSQSAQKPSYASHLPDVRARHRCRVSGVGVRVQTGAGSDAAAPRRGTAARKVMLSRGPRVVTFVADEYQVSGRGGVAALGGPRLTQAALGPTPTPSPRRIRATCPRQATETSIIPLYERADRLERRGFAERPRS